MSANGDAARRMTCGPSDVNRGRKVCLGRRGMFFAR